MKISIAKITLKDMLKENNHHKDEMSAVDFSYRIDKNSRMK